MKDAGLKKPAADGLLETVGPRLRDLRRERGLTLEDLSEQTGISVSTLSRTETGNRRPTLEMLLTLSWYYHVPLDDLVGAEAPTDPRVQLQPRTLENGQRVWPLTNHADGVQAWKIELPATTRPPELRSHEGYEWFYVLRGKVRLLLEDCSYLLAPGEAVEFDTRLPYWFGSTPGQQAQILSLFSREGERVHFKAAP